MHALGVGIVLANSCSSHDHCSCVHTVLAAASNWRLDMSYSNACIRSMSLSNFAHTISCITALYQYVIPAGVGIIPAMSRSMMKLSASTTDTVYRVLCIDRATQDKRPSAQTFVLQNDFFIISNYVCKVEFVVPYLFKYSRKPTSNLSIPETIEVNSLFKKNHNKNGGTNGCSRTVVCLVCRQPTKDRLKQSVRHKTDYKTDYSS